MPYSPADDVDASDGRSSLQTEIASPPSMPFEELPKEHDKQSVIPRTDLK
jgi:hypothetical protein